VRLALSATKGSPAAAFDIREPCSRFLLPGQQLHKRFYSYADPSSSPKSFVFKLIRIVPLQTICFVILE